MLKRFARYSITGHWWKITTFVIVLLLLGTAVFAQDMAEPQTFVVHYGGFGPGNITAYWFAPNDVKVHRGDTVTWILDAETNVHFEEAALPVFVPAEVNGATMPIYNPGIAFPTIENGGTYTGGDVNSGALGLVSLDQGLKAFSLVMDVEPGTYTYFSDIHVRTGTITVVPDDEAIPSPGEAAVAAAVELETILEEGIEAYAAAQLEMDMEPEGPEHRIMIGMKAGDAYIRQFFPEVLVIKAGDSVTWEVPAENADGHTVTWPPMGLGQLFSEVETDGDTPVYTLGPAVAPMAESGSEIRLGDKIGALVGAGATYTLTFVDPGVYPYVDNLHAPGMEGVIVVMPAD